jgi:hypothetical protein
LNAAEGTGRAECGVFGLNRLRKRDEFIHVRWDGNSHLVFSSILTTGFPMAFPMKSPVA